MRPNILPNSRFEILTPGGWSDFSGVRITEKERHFVIKFDTGRELRCTEEHLIKTRNGFVAAESLKCGDAVVGVENTIAFIESIRLVDVVDKFYDCLDVKRNNEYYTNGVVSHNCEFLGGEGTLLDNRILIEREKEIISQGSNVLFQIHDVPFFTQIKTGATYLIGVDPATGTGRDYTAIELLEFPSLEQVMEFRSNNTRSSDIYALLRKIIKFLTQNDCEVLFSVENNGVGEGIISLYDVDEDFPDKAIMIHEEGKNRYGFTTTEAIKLKYANKLKTLIETGSLPINSVTLLRELKNYARYGKAYAAKSGSTDDCISAYLIIIRILDDMATYDEEAYEKLYALSIDANDEWSNDDIQMVGDDEFDDGIGYIV